MKKLVALILIISLVLVPCLAYADTAFEDNWILEAGGIKPIEVAAIEATEIKAATSNTDVFLQGYSVPNAMNFYYFGSGSQATTFSNGFAQLPLLAQAITYSIAYSTQNLNTKIQTALTTLNTAVSNIKTGVGNINTSSGNTAINTSNIYSRLGTMNTSIDNLKSYTDDVESTLTSILSAIQNQTFDLGTFIPNFMPDSSYDFSDPSWTTVQRRTVTTDGASSMSGFTSPYMILQLRELLRANNNAAALTYDKMFNMVTGSDYNDANYHVIFSPLTGNQVTLYKRSFWVDYRTVSRYITRGLSLITALDPNASYTLTDKNLRSNTVTDISIGDYLRQFGENASYYLARLNYVLASDAEIDMRMSSEANTTSALHNYVSSSGGASFNPHDLSSLSDFTSSVTDDIVPSTASPTLLVNTLNDDDVWSWFTQSTADALEPTSRLRNESKSSDPGLSSTPLLDSYYHDLEQALGVSYDR